ncbi:hypothetical protein F444_22064 [Phytophthora nicotianae P1976]|uniref:FYVE-type domain-containing protein n=1 Tax=Phytophthora nicotianae P1976 TaxID=1317066 RepID=A0A080YZ08_PHYNI|nr:hypothetical protein F444_22064 [Phytophthora nicotianae P1976]
MASFGAPDLVRGSAHSTSRSGRSGHSGRSGRGSARHDMDSSMANSTNCANLKHGYNSSAEGYIPGKLPLPDDFFPVPQLSAKENKYLLGLAKHACKEVVYYSRQDDGPMKWLHLSSEDGVDVFQGVDNSGTSDMQQDAKALTYLRGSCKIHATIDEISDFFKLDTPEKLSGFAQTVGKDLLDQKTLLTLATPTPDNPKHYVAVKWTAVESPSKLTRHRDFCYIECHDEFIDTNTKRRGWVRSIHSIRLPFCPPLNRSHGLVRGSFYRSGYIFTESAEKGCVDAVHTLHVDIKGNAPNWLKILVMKRRIKNIAQVNHHFQLQRLTQEKLLGDLELPAKEGVTHCQLCETRFGLFHRRRLCRKCGKVVCNACGNEFMLDYAGVGPKKVRICLECSESVVYGTSVPMMDDSGRIIEDEHTGAKKLDDSVIHPMYDESMIILENRHHSIDENEYYLENEDANGLADMEEAKRMNREFEEMLKKTSDEFNASRIQEERRFNTNAKSLLGMNSASGETLPVDTPLGASDLAPWEEQNKEDDMEDDDELGLPPSKSEQMRKQLQYEEQMRRENVERAKKMQQYAIEQCDPPTRPRAHGFVRNESGDSLRLSSEHGEEYYGTGAIGRIGPDRLTSFRSNNSGRGVSRSELSDDGRSRSRSRSSHEFRHIPRRREAGFRSRHDSEERDAFESQRRTQQYFDARNALLSGGQHRHTVDFEPTMAARFRSSGIGAGSDPPVRRQLAGSELESPYTSLSDSNIAGAFTTRRRHRSDDLEDRNDEAFRLAMSAMRLYEEERGPSLHVTEETRQAALAKMMEVYAREIERSHSHDAPYSRGTISDTRRLHHDVGIPPPLRRTVSDDRPPSIYGSPLQVFRHDELFPTPRRQRRPNSKKHRREDTYAPSLPTKERKQKSEDTHEYRDLSDLTSSAFQAFQMNSLGPRDAPKLPVDVVESSEDSDSKHEDTQPPAQFQRESTSTTHVQLKSDTSGAAYGSMESNEVSNMISRPNSMYGVASDTFSDMDFTDLPHLMRKDDVDGARSSFTDLQHWTEEPSENGGVEYAPEPRLSDLLSPLHLEDVQHVDDDDSESQSSNSSSQIDWQSSMSNQYQGTQGRARGTDSESSFVRTYSISRQNEAEAYSDLTNTNNGLSESMVTQNDPPQRQYSKPPSLSELLSEYCDSERSSLPSYLEFGGSQPELEPEYLEAIANATTGNQNTIPMEGGRRGHVRRRSSIPSELEAMTSRELFL